MGNSSDIKKDGYICFWRIENFSFCKSENNLKLRSQSFKIKLLNNSKWHLELDHSKDDLLSVYLVKDAHAKGKSKIHFSLSILASYGWLSSFTYENQTFKSGGPSLGEGLILWQIVFENNSRYLHNGSVIISCRIWKENNSQIPHQCVLNSRMINTKHILYINKQEFTDLKSDELFTFFSQNTIKPLFCTCLENNPKKVKDKHTQIEEAVDSNIFNDVDNLLRFFAEKKFSYVTLKTASKDFAVHKALICARSPVFCAMFDKNMKENERNIVDIDDVDSETLTLLLQFLHSEPLGHLNWENAKNLYYAADKYQIEQLKNECSFQLKNKVTTENVCELLILSDMHRDEDLKHYSQEYFCKHSKVLLRSSEWDDILTNKRDLAREVLIALAEKL